MRGRKRNGLERAVRMTQANDRDVAADLAQRIESSLIDPSRDDESTRQPGDRPPRFAKVLMDDPVPPPERAINLKPNDWELIARALRHFARCEAGDTPAT
jgi:hypothetical protein